MKEFFSIRGAGSLNKQWMVLTFESRMSTIPVQAEQESAWCAWWVALG